MSADSESQIEIIRRTAEALRQAIRSAKVTGADIPWLKRFPERCCNFTSNLLLLDLAAADIVPVRRMIGTLMDDKGNDIGSHVWVEAGGLTVDIAGDSYGLESVVVEESSGWHTSLSDIKPFIERIDVEEGISAEELNRLRELYGDTLEALAPHRPAIQ